MKKIGIPLLIVGILCLGAGFYIRSEVQKGKEQISSAKEKVNQGHSIMSLTPLTKGMQDHIAAPVEKKIEAGESEVRKYETMYKQLFIFGCLVALVGLILSFVWKKR